MPIMTCVNHTDRIWSVKQEGISAGRYNEQRNIFYFGSAPFEPFSDGSGFRGLGALRECPCPGSDLRVIQCAMCDSNPPKHFTLGNWYCEPCAFEVHGA